MVKLSEMLEKIIKIQEDLKRCKTRHGKCSYLNRLTDDSTLTWVLHENEIPSFSRILKSWRLQIEDQLKSNKGNLIETYSIGLQASRSNTIDERYVSTNIIVLTVPWLKSMMDDKIMHDIAISVALLQVVLDYYNLDYILLKLKDLKNPDQWSILYYTLSEMISVYVGTPIEPENPQYPLIRDNSDSDENTLLILDGYSE